MKNILSSSLLFFYSFFAMAHVSIGRQADELIVNIENYDAHILMALLEDIELKQDGSLYGSINCSLHKERCTIKLNLKNPSVLIYKRKVLARIGRHERLNYILKTYKKLVFDNKILFSMEHDMCYIAIYL